MNNSEQNQAALNNRQWIADYRKRMAEVPAQVSPVDTSQLVELLSNQGTAGVGAATGLAGAQALLGGWLAGANAKSRKAEFDLANERWLKQNEDEAEERAYNRKRIEKEDEVFVPTEDLGASPFSGITPTEEQRARSKGQVAANRIEAERLMEQRKADRKNISERESFVKPTITGRAVETTNYGGLSGLGNRVLSATKGLFSKSAAAENNAIIGLRSEGVSNVGNVDPSFFRARAKIEADKKNGDLAVQLNKIAAFIETLGKNVSVKSNITGDIVSIGVPSGDKFVLTPDTIDNVISKFNVRVAQ